MVAICDSIELLSYFFSPSNYTKHNTHSQYFWHVCTNQACPEIHLYWGKPGLKPWKWKVGSWLNWPGQLLYKLKLWCKGNGLMSEISAIAWLAQSWTSSAHTFLGLNSIYEFHRFNLSIKLASITLCNQDQDMCVFSFHLCCLWRN